MSLIRDAYLKPIGIFDNSTIRYRFNRTCQRCLCEALNSSSSMNYMAVNCFVTTSVCQFFQSYPASYKIASTSGSQLYFLHNTFPSASQCCMPNITDLLNRLMMTITTPLSLTFQPAAFGYDEQNPTDAIVSGWSSDTIAWFNPLTMILSRSTSLPNGLTVTLYNNQLLTSTSSSRSIFVSDESTLTLLVNVSYSSLNQVRKIIFLNNGQTMAIPTQDNSTVTLFNINSPSNYTLQVNESFFSFCCQRHSLFLDSKSSRFPSQPRTAPRK